MTRYTIPRIETERLVLRAPKLDDLTPLTDFFQTERSHVVGGPQDARSVHRGMMSCFGVWALLGFGRWHIADADTDAFLGWVGAIYGPDWDEPELGWTVLPEAEGRGIAFEAAAHARRFMRLHLGIMRPISYIAKDNTRSQALARRLGAEVERGRVLLGHEVDIWRHPETEGALA